MTSAQQRRDPQPMSRGGELAQVLGRSRLRQARGIIRPDLY